MVSALDQIYDEAQDQISLIGQTCATTNAKVTRVLSLILRFDSTIEVMVILFEEPNKQKRANSLIPIIKGMSFNN